MATRRQFLGGLLAAGATLATPTAGFASPPTVRAQLLAGLPPPRPWRAQTGEVEPWVKRRATSLIEAVGTWDTRSDPAAATVKSARDRATKAGFAADLAESLPALFGSGTANVARIRDAQYGGILSHSASVLLVVDTWRGHSDGTVTAGGFTVDVRLVKGSPQWRVIDVLAAKPHTRATQLSDVARRILADDHIHLPFSAMADVAGGQIHDAVLRALESLAAAYVLDVSVLQSGHPRFVFGTTRLSDHPRGRAVDIWALNGRPLLLTANHGLAKRAMRQAVTLGAYNVGGPILLPGSPYFSDATHHDHIHLGFPS